MLKQIVFKQLNCIIIFSNAADDESGNQHSLNRKLDRRLVLLFNLKLGNNYQWLLPQAKNEENETLREVRNEDHFFFNTYFYALFDRQPIER